MQVPAQGMPCYPSHFPQPVTTKTYLFVLFSSKALIQTCENMFLFNQTK